MKNIKAGMLILALAACTIQLTRLHAGNETALLPPYQEVISDIALEYNEGMLNGRIKLVSGAILNIIDYKTRDDTSMSKWRAGDALAFTPHVQKEKLIMAVNRLFYERVENEAEPYVIFDSINSPKTARAIIEINDKGKSIQLSDNSRWDFSFYNSFTTEEWSVGERVLVNGPNDNNSYTLINLDVPLKHSVYSAIGSFVMD
ncbi:MAG: hypothetical protein H0V82_10305 [Candidatus Protochlamydia sp.]|nr:hypothetical protein [Candidatus Protochlamydia sp.]